MKRNEYDQKAEGFLTKFGLEFKVAHKGPICPPWEDDSKHIHGDKFRVTLKRKAERKSVSFDFWNSLNDKQKNIPLRAYSVLACISSDVHTPDNFDDFCSEFGYDTDSRKAEQIFKRVDKFARQLREFFTEAELEALNEIN